MGNKRIDELPGLVAADLEGDDLLLVWDTSAGAVRRIPVAALLAGTQPASAMLAALAARGIGAAAETDILDRAAADARYLPASPLPGGYEEGSWTPTLAGSTVAGTHTLSLAIGRYERIGNQVTARFAMTVSAKDAAATGTVRIGGLPYVSAAGVGLTPGAVQIGNLTLPAGCTQAAIVIGANANAAILVSFGSGASVSPDISAAVTNGTFIRGSITYRIAS